jgi:murein DD-endopeptidase MepM/ murein hydrolase activator NlpD
LELTYKDGAKIGFIQDESVYIEAQGLVNKQLETVAVARAVAGETIEETQNEEVQDKENDTFEIPIYEIARVDLNELSDEVTLSDSLIENSVNKLTTACGVYIDGECIGAVQNETDATGVFENLLEPYKTDNASTNAAFVEDVRFVQGLYDSTTTMMDANELKEILNGKKVEAKYYTVKSGETIWSIATANDLSESALLNLNPGQDELIKTGDQLKVSNEVNFIRVKIIKTEVRIEDIPYETIKSNNSTLFTGDSRTTRQGVYGADEVTELVTYIDDTKVTAQETNRVHLSDPIARKLDVGTKSTKVYSSSGTYNVTVSNEGFVWPVPGYYNRVSSPFGYRSRGFHSGVDISGSGVNGTVIVAAKDGVVVSAGWSSGGLGYRVVINHGGGIVTRYGHCLSGSISVSAGQTVSAGQAIARVGSTGNSTGPHLHFEVKRNGTAVNPLPYIL